MNKRAALERLVQLVEEQMDKDGLSEDEKDRRVAEMEVEFGRMSGRMPFTVRNKQPEDAETE